MKQSENEKQHEIKIKSLRFNVWLFFMLFILVIFLFLWFFQIIFLQGFYKEFKKTGVNEAAKIVNSFNSNTDDFSELRSFSSENGLCITIVKASKGKLDFEDGKPWFENDVTGSGCVIHSSKENSGKYLELLNDYVIKIQGAPNSIYTEEMESGSEFIYAAALGDEDNPYGYLFIETPVIQPPSTVQFIRRQLIYLTVFLAVLGFVISAFMSKTIAKPIVNITKAAEKLADGNYNINFEGGEYTEAQKLASTLNFAAKEISKVDGLQRDLIANVSHDLRTPLTMVKAYAEMIRDLSGDIPEKREEHLNVIIEETDRLALLVNDMLDLSKLESGGQQLIFSSFGIRALLEEILDRYREFCEKQGYTIIFEPDLEIDVRCDVVKIQQVIYNLINNAINYTGSDKKIIVRQKNIFNGVKIEVTDTGQGIEQENIHLIFDKYYRSEKHKREVVGTGLGLSIVQVILKKHNFPYGVKSEVGKGSTFWFKIISL